jgi:hypothetical protein
VLPRDAGEWAFGAGHQAITFVSPLDEDSYLEHAQSWYSASKSFGLTPGHSSAQGERYRTFSPDAAILKCFSCHSTGPLRLEPGYRIAPFEPGVRCESCHGPGAAHVAAKGKRDLIRNPKRFDAGEINQFCGACHRKHAADEDTNWAQPWNVRHQPLYLARSRCFEASDGKLSCFTCHAPHSGLSRSASAYDAQCRSCHAVVAHQMPVADRACVECHMPVVRLTENLRFANHWIGVYGPQDSLIPVSQP